MKVKRNGAESLASYQTAHAPILPITTTGTTTTHYHYHFHYRLIIIFMMLQERNRNLLHHKLGSWGRMTAAPSIWEPKHRKSFLELIEFKRMKALNRFVFEGRRIDAELWPFSEWKVVGGRKVKVRDITLPPESEGF